MLRPGSLGFAPLLLGLLTGVLLATLLRLRSAVLARVDDPVRLMATHSSLRAKSPSALGDEASLGKPLVPAAAHQPQKTAPLPSSLLAEIESSNTTKSKHRVLCFVPTKDARSEAVDLVFTTWGRYCDRLLFTSTAENPMRGVVKLNLPTLTGGGLWNIIHPGWRHLYENYVDSYEWFLKIDDDAYFNAYNFKHLVRNLNPNDSHYLGHTQHHLTPRLFNLGAGHAISQGSLRALGPRLPGEDSSKDKQGYTCSRKHTWAEDVEFSHCLSTANLDKVTSSRDALKRETFVAFQPNDALKTVRRSDSHSWFWANKPVGLGSGAGCCSARPVLFHGLKVAHGQAKTMRWIDYLLTYCAVDPIDLSEA